MGFCANTSCGQKLAVKKGLKAMNKKGIYTPEQINNACEKAWLEVNPEEKTIVNMEEC